MTREEAVEVLKERYLTCVGIGLDNHANRVNEAIDMATEALSEPRGDLISREDAIDAICKSWCYVTYMDCPHADDGFRCDGCDDIEAIEALPSALADIGDYADRLWKIAYERGKAEAFDMAVEALQREEAEAKGYCHRYLDKGLLMFLALSFPAPEEAPDDWFHHGDENLDAWRAYIMKCKERGYYDIPVEY